MTLVAAADVVAIDVGLEHDAQVAFTCDENPVGVLAANRSDDAFSDRFHPWRLRRSKHDVDADGGEHSIEGHGELRIPVSDQVREALAGASKSATSPRASCVARAPVG
jgi:hypothetical protein